MLQSGENIPWFPDMKYLVCYPVWEATFRDDWGTASGRGARTSLGIT